MTTYRLTIRYTEHADDYEVKTLTHDWDCEHEWTCSDGAWQFTAPNRGNGSDWTALIPHLCSATDVLLVEPSQTQAETQDAAQSDVEQVGKAGKADKVEIPHLCSAQTGETVDPDATHIMPVVRPAARELRGDDTQVIQTITGTGTDGTDGTDDTNTRKWEKPPITYRPGVASQHRWDRRR